MICGLLMRNMQGIFVIWRRIAFNLQGFVRDVHGMLQATNRYCELLHGFRIFVVRMNEKMQTKLAR